MRPTEIPIGFALHRTARAVSRAFDEALSEAGGSLPVWLVLLSLRLAHTANQRQLAEAVGVSAATLTHHLNAMEADGLIVRRRDPDNRRNHLIELTPGGEEAFLGLAAAAHAFDQRLRTNLDAAQLAVLRQLLDRLSANVGAAVGAPPWAAAPGTIPPSPQEASHVNPDD